MAFGVTSAGAMPAVLTVLLALALAVPGAASAQSSSIEGDLGNGGEAQGLVSSAESGPIDSELGSLGFTGLDLGWMIGGAIILTAVGIGMGRAATRPPDAG